ncbi:MFS transporter [Microlunatus endophyticus]|uniref:MFS transporter n=1 Tax=Microlunatus endophyticus TaxID=1716077 RepID=A0A917SIM5_9ACTN|nr:MFS transporter [Microlunatus endophyticus]
MLKSIFWPVLAPAFLYACGTGALTPVIVLAALSLGAHQAVAGAIVTAAAVAAGVAAIPAGYVINSLGERRSMIGATAVAAALTAVSVFALVTHNGSSLPIFIVAVVLVGSIEVVWSLARQALIAETVERESMALAMTSLGGAARAGQLVGPLIGSVLLLKLPLYSVFIMHIFLALAATVLIAFGPADPPKRKPVGSGRANRKLQVRWSAVFLAGFAIMTLSMARQGKNVIIPLWGDHLHLTASSISLMVALGSAVELILIYPGGRLKDSLGRVSTFVACVTLLGIGFAILPIGGTIAFFIIGVAVASVGNGLGAGINMTFGADLSPSVGRAKFLGYWNALGQVGSLLGPGLISVLIAVASLPVAVLSLAAAPLVGGIWMAGFRHRIGLPGRRRVIIPAPDAVADESQSQ